MKHKTRFKQTEIGKIPEDWEMKALGSLLKNKGYIRGPFGSTLRRPELKKEGIPVYEQEHAIYNRREFRYFIDNEKFHSLFRFAVEENDLIISCSGTFGKVSIIKKEDPRGIISQALLILRPDTNKINPDYLKFFFTSKQGFNEIASRSLGSVQVNIAKRSIIEKIDLPIPPLPEQRLIASVLSSLDDKIELNNKMNKTLEAIGQAIFKKWFIDEKDESLEMGKLGDIVEFLKGKKPKNISKIDVEGYKNQILIENLNGIKPLYANPVNTTKVNLYEPIMVMDGASSGRTEIGHIGILGSTLAKIISKNDEISNFFIYYFLKLHEADINANTTGTSIPHADKNKIKLFQFSLPVKDKLNNFDKLAKSIINKIILNKKQNQILSQIRDALLPKLMSGEVRVSIGVKR